MELALLFSQGRPSASEFLPAFLPLLIQGGYFSLLLNHHHNDLGLLIPEVCNLCLGISHQLGLFL